MNKIATVYHVVLEDSTVTFLTQDAARRFAGARKCVMLESACDKLQYDIIRSLAEGRSAKRAVKPSKDSF